MNTKPVNQQENYKAQEHLIMLKTTNGPKEYYSFAWRQHEFRLRYPLGILAVEALLLDADKDLVVIRCTAKADDMGNCTGVGLFTGSLALIDQVIERAKAQAFADMGIGCLWPVVFEDELATAEIIHSQVSHTEKDIQESLVQQTSLVAQSNGYDAAITSDTVKAFYAQVYRVQSPELEAKWAKFVQGICGRALSKGALTEDELNRLNGVLCQARDRQASNGKKAVV